jgi:L-ribulose-5-phosphate 3-epimerase UlaE
VVWAVVLVGYALLTSIALCAERRYPLGEENAPIVLRQATD